MAVLLAYDENGKQVAINEEWTIHCKDEYTYNSINKLMEKDTEKEPEEQEFGGFGDKICCCPSCHESITGFSFKVPNYCSNCGQRLKWGEE